MLLSDLLVFASLFAARKVMGWGSADETPVLGYVIAIPIAIAVIVVVQIGVGALNGSG